MTLGLSSEIRIKNVNGDNNQVPDPDEFKTIESDLKLPQLGVDAYAPIPLANLCPNTFADFNLFLNNSEGKFVLFRGANTTLTGAHISNLQENRIDFLFISKKDRAKYIRYMESNLITILTTKSSVPEKALLVYESANQLLKDVLLDPGSGENIDRVDKLIDATISLIMYEEGYLINMLDVMAFDYSTYTHSVNVCVLGLALGNRLGIPQDQLSKLGTGLLLHDVGKSQISRDILFKKGALTEQEWALIKKHPQMGEELLGTSGKVDPKSMAVVVQHHEKCSGGGYPLGLDSEQIDPFAKIAAIADVFDALTTERVYKGAIDTFPAIQLMMSDMSESFCSDYLREFVLMLNLSGSRNVIDPRHKAEDPEADAA